MQVESSRLLEPRKPLLIKLLHQLLETYSYASILANDSRGKDYAISNAGTNIEVSDMLTETGYVIKVYDGAGYGEYAFNELREENIPDILAAVNGSLMPWKDALPEAVGQKHYPQIPDEPISFVKSTEYEVHPEEAGDQAILAKLSALREKIKAQDDALLDAQVRFSYEIYHKIFLSPNKDMEQNVMWAEGIAFAIGARGEEIKTAYKSSGGCGGLEGLDGLDEQIPELLATLHRMLESKPMVPGEYDCICAPDVTGLIVHEAFGHGVEMDMFVKDRALAQQYIGKYVASPLVTMHDGAAACGSMPATYFFDDEGTIAQDTVIIEKGILKRGICDAQAAMALCLPPTGNGRREATSHKAYTRMTNTFF